MDLVVILIMIWFPPIYRNWYVEFYEYNSIGDFTKLGGGDARQI